MVNVKKKENVALPRNYTDYDFDVYISKLPKGVQIGFLDEPYGEIIWDKVPDNTALQGK